MLSEGKCTPQHSRSEEDSAFVLILDPPTPPLPPHQLAYQTGVGCLVTTATAVCRLAEAVGQRLLVDPETQQSSATHLLQQVLWREHE